jgi:hypothetical protein
MERRVAWARNRHLGTLLATLALINALAAEKTLRGVGTNG